MMCCYLETKLIVFGRDSRIMKWGTMVVRGCGRYGTEMQGRGFVGGAKKRVFFLLECMFAAVLDTYHILYHGWICWVKPDSQMNYFLCLTLYIFSLLIA